MIKKNWKVDTIDEDFLKKFYGKTNVLFNLRYLLDKCEISVYQVGDTIVEDQKKVLDFDKTIIMERIVVVKDIVSKLGFDLKDIGDKKLLSRDGFLDNIGDLQVNGKLYLDANRTKMLFGCIVKKFEWVDDDEDGEKNEDGEDKKKKYEIIKPFMGFINRLLKEWGLVICVKRKSKRIKIDGKVRFKKTNKYYLNFYNNINQYI